MWAGHPSIYTRTCDHHPTKKPTLVYLEQWFEQLFGQWGSPPPLTKVPLPPCSPAHLASPLMGTLMCLPSHRLAAIKGPSKGLFPLMVTVQCCARFTRCNYPHLSYRVPSIRTYPSILCTCFGHNMGLHAPNLELTKLPLPPPAPRPISPPP